MTVYCYDTEFLEDGRTIELISIGIVSDDGREYYAINSDADWDRIRKDDWLMDNVVRHLPATRQPQKRTGFGEHGWSWSGINLRDTRVKPKWVIANEVREFLLAGGPPELWAYYGAYDHVALAQLWGRMISLPKGIPMFTHELMQEINRAGLTDRDMPCTTAEHDALADSRWNLAVARQLGLCR